MKSTRILAHEISFQDLETVKKIIKSEDLQATAKMGFDTMGDTTIEVEADAKTFNTLRSVWRMVTGKE